MRASRLLVNHYRLRRDREFSGEDVALSNVRMGANVRRGMDCRRTWPEEAIAGRRGGIHRRGRRAGGAQHVQRADSITQANGAGWVCVRWSETGSESTYPIGAEGIFSLAFVGASTELN